jgi:hypothetical protein
MKKRFNTTGVCIPEKHYMVDISDKITDILKMVERGDYFVINRPRQYGKTTTIYMLNRLLKSSDEFFPIKLSFEGMGTGSFENEKVFIEEFFLLLLQVFKTSGNENLVNFLESEPTPDSFNRLGIWLNKLPLKTKKKMILMIDEVDKSSNNQLFLDFLGMLRNKYLKRDEEGEFTFHSVILVGVHDVKSLKIKLRPDTEAKFNSPWNIAVDFKIDLNFLPGKIVSMLEDYSKENNVKIQAAPIAERIYYYTSGYPFLVSKLCEIVDEEILSQRPVKEWYMEDIDRAVQVALTNDNTNFESLIKNLENNPDLYDFVFKLIINGTEFMFNLDNPVIHFGVIYGILKNEKGKCKIHNRLYEQRVYNYLSSKIETSGSVTFDIVGKSFIDKDGKLDIKKVIFKFQEFMKQQYSIKDLDFLERSGRLLFLAFIKPIINGRGFDFKEVQVSEEKRLDVVITFDNEKYIIELKIWRGESYHKEGIDQLCGYLDRLSETSGYLLIFDLRKESGQTGKYDEIETNDKKIFTAWV